MGSSARLFVAIDPGPGLREVLREDTRKARQEVGGWRWVRAENVHLTLRFLGATDAARVDALGGGLRALLRGRAAFELALSSTWGAFPNARRPRVLWRAIGGDLGDLQDMAGAVESWAREEGYEPETRPFRPHLTLARAPRGRRMREIALDELAAGRTSRFAVDEVILFESELGPGGPQYTAHARAPLAPSHPVEGSS